MATLEKKSLQEAYLDVRNDQSPTSWCIFKYEGNQIVVSDRGADFDEFKSHFRDDERLFGYLRMITGDELSKRSKFAFISWAGPTVGVLKQAKMAADKAKIKEVVQNFAIEFHTNDINEIEEEHIKGELTKAGGANYGTGVRA